jgi:hypothetical protein
MVSHLSRVVFKAAKAQIFYQCYKKCNDVTKILVKNLQVQQPALQQITLPHRIHSPCIIVNSLNIVCKVLIFTSLEAMSAKLTKNALIQL